MTSPKTMADVVRSIAEAICDNTDKIEVNELESSASSTIDVKVAGKKVRYGRKFGKTKAWKKAIISLATDDKIEIYEGV